MLQNIISIDVEGSIEGKVAIQNNNSIYKRTNHGIKEIGYNIDVILDFLHKHYVKATFFILGSVAKDMTSLVYKIANFGHEIASHGMHHQFLHLLPNNIVKQHIIDSKDIIENSASKKIYGFRAPFFSVNEKTMYIFDEIMNAGYLYDSSIYPIRGHDLYGFFGSKISIHKMNNGLIEMPLSVMRIMGLTFPVLGGGYYRLYPYYFNKVALESLNKKKNIPGIIYLHPYEIGGKYHKILKVDFLKNIRYYHNSGNKVRVRLKKMFKSHRFGSHIDFLEQYKFD